MQRDKRISRERVETPTVQLKAMIEADLDKQWVWGGIGAGEDAWGGQDGYRRELSGGKIGKLKGGVSGVGLVWVNKTRKDHGFRLGMI